MKKVKFLVAILAMLLVGLNNLSANEIENPKKTAETVLALANSFEELTPENSAILKAEIKDLSVKERIRLAKISYKMAKEANETKVTEKAKPGLYILAVIIPFVAVGIHTDWTKPTLFNVLWSMAGYLPGIIHAFIVLGR
jgi:uncharacterized membrane protein YqaE (UPF0057 family)